MNDVCVSPYWHDLEDKLERNTISLPSLSYAFRGQWALSSTVLDATSSTVSVRSLWCLAVVYHGQSANQESADKESLSLDFWEIPMDLGIPALKIKNMIETEPLKSRFLVRGLTTSVCHRLLHWSITPTGTSPTIHVVIVWSPLWCAAARLKLKGLQVDCAGVPCGRQGLSFRAQGLKNEPFQNKRAKVHWFRLCKVSFVKIMKIRVKY